MALDYNPTYVALVTAVGQGDSGRAIKVQTQWLPSESGLVHPMFDGLIKLPSPAKDEFVLVFQADDSNLHRWYMPINTSFATLTSNKDNLQIESAGDVEIHGTAVKIGSEATEAMVLGDTLNDLLNDLITKIIAHQHVGNLGIPVVAVVPPADLLAIAAQLSTILASIGKVY